MSGAIVIAVDGIEDLPDLEGMDAAVTRAARRAVNASADRARAWSAREMREQVSFPSGYLQSQDRFRVVKRAKGPDLEAVIRGRREATSLARFATSRRKERGGVTVEVNPGSAVFMRRAFLIKLQAGDPSIRNLKNMGLAVRTDGQKPRAAYKPKKLEKNVWLLYGPSVDQVFRTVAVDVQPDVEEYLNREFRRLLELENARV